MKFTDSHCHLDFLELASQLPQLLKHCHQKGIHRIIVPSVSPSNWQTVLDLKQKSQNIAIYPCVGIHPWYLQELTESALTALAKIVENEKSNLIAIGEMGIDGVIANEQHNLVKQCEFFEAQLHLAQSHKLPAIVHHRRSHNEVISIIKASSFTQGGVIHAFSGSYQQATQYIDLGFKLGIGGTITYPRAKKTINAIKRIAPEHLLLETDAPAMPLNGRQGEINTPLQLIEVFSMLQSVLAIDEEDLAVILERNVDQLFKLN